MLNKKKNTRKIGEIKNEIDDIIKILLIDLSSISSYYLTKWKNEVSMCGTRTL